jgi:hypothetical protein
MAEVISGLGTFTDLLRRAHLTIRFVRFPTGLISELSHYIAGGLRPSETQHRLARAMIAGGVDESTLSPHERTVYADYQRLLGALTHLHLHEWGDATPATGHETTAQSWEIESSGDPTGTRVDTLTRDWVRHAMRAILTRSTHEKFSVILAHDLSPQDVEEVHRDMAMIERAAVDPIDDGPDAERANIQIEHYTMSDLYQSVWGHSPS